MTENIEWGACPVCGGRVAGEVDSWECNGLLHVEQSYDNPPTCENGCPLEGFAPRIDLVAECGDGESDKETAERAAKKEWSRMCGIATRLDPCVCGGTHRECPQARRTRVDALLHRTVLIAARAKAVSPIARVSG